MVNKTDHKITDIDTVNHFSMVVYGDRSIDLGLAARYEYNLNLLRGKPEARFRPLIGFAGSPYFTRTSIQPFVSLSYPERDCRVGLDLAVVPRILWHINENWYLDLNVPVSLVDLGLEIRRTDNPVLPLEDRTTSTIDLLGFPARVHVRLGVGLRL